MRTIITILILMICSSIYAQQPAMLSIEGIGGNGDEYLGQWIAPSSIGGGIIRYSTASDLGTGNINTQCNQTTSQKSSVFRKYDPEGIIEWEKCYRYNDDSGWAFLYPLSDGSFILGGFKYSIPQFQIRKEDASGNIIWGNKYYGGSADESIVDFIATNDGGFILLGESNSDDGDVGLHHGDVFNMDLWVLKVDSNGEKVWSTVIGGTAGEIAFKVLNTQEGGCYVIGSTLSTDNDCIGNHGGLDVLVSKLDTNGQIIWTKCYGGTDHEGNQFGYSVENGSEGLLLATDAASSDGDVSNHITGSDYWLVNLDSSGAIIWDRCFEGGSGVERVYSVCKANDGSIWMNGKSGDSTFIVHTSNSGNHIASKTLTNSVWNYGTMLMPLTNGFVLAGGSYEGPGIANEFATTWYGVYDIFLAKFAPWTTDLDIVNTATQSSVYPNPNNGDFTIETKGTGKLTIYSLQGQKIGEYATRAGATNITLPKGTVPGVYIGRYEGEGGTAESIRISYQQ